MDLLGSYREFRRRHNGVLIWLRLEEWPVDIPLPPGTRVVETGDGPFDPYWRFVLEPDRTIEAVVGWFILPLSLEGAIEWYQAEMIKRGWEELAEGSYRMPRAAAVRFQQPGSNVCITVGLSPGPDTEQTDAMIRRIVEHPWSPPSNGKGAGANAKPATRTPKAKKRRAPRAAQGAWSRSRSYRLSAVCSLLTQCH